MNNIRKMGAFLGAGAVIFSLAGCADKNGDGQAESPANANNVDGAVKDNLADTANAVSGAVGGAANVASNAAGAVADGASKMGGAIVNAGEAATMTPAVKTAIGANAGLKGSKIDVTTMGAKDSISLTGTVKSAAQKNLAGAVAKKAAPGYKINNMLKMGGAGKM